MDAYLAKQVRYLYGIEIRVSTTGRYYRFTPPQVTSRLLHCIVVVYPPHYPYPTHWLHTCPTPAPRLVYLCLRLAEGMMIAKQADDLRLEDGWLQLANVQASSLLLEVEG